MSEAMLLRTTCANARTTIEMYKSRLCQSTPPMQTAAGATASLYPSHLVPFPAGLFKKCCFCSLQPKFVPRTSSSLASAVQPGKPTQKHCVFNVIACKMVPQHIRMQLKCDQRIPGGVYLRPSAQVKVHYIKCSGAQVFDIRAHQPILLHWILKGIFQVFDIALIQYIQV